MVSGKSFFSNEYFLRLQQADAKVILHTGDITCRSASGQALQMLGYVTVFLGFMLLCGSFLCLFVAALFHLNFGV
jgi:hypothetical protein